MLVLPQPKSALAWRGLQLGRTEAPEAAPLAAPRAPARHRATFAFARPRLYGLAYAAPTEARPTAPPPQPYAMKRPWEASEILPRASDAAQRMVRTRTLAHEHRSTDVALAASGASAAFNALTSVEAGGRAVIEMSRCMDLSSSRVSALSQYDIYCKSKGNPGAIMPITLLCATGYAGWYVFSKKNMSSSLDTVISNLRVAAHAIGQWALSHADERDMSKVIDALQRAAPATPRESEGANLDGLVTLMERLKTSSAPEDIQTGYAIALSVGFKMRAVELTGNDKGSRGILRRDVRVDESGAGSIFDAVSVKTGQKSLQARPRAAPHINAKYGALCVSWWTTRYMELTDPHGTQPDLSPIFCVLTPAGQWGTVRITGQALTQRIFAAMQSAGMDTTGLNAEWGRHTGDDLYVMKCGIPRSVSDFIGDHVQNKCTSERHYSHVKGRGRDMLLTGYTHVFNFLRKTCCRSRRAATDPSGVIS
jgi:hypothetical protein